MGKETQGLRHAFKAIYVPRTVKRANPKGFGPVVAAFLPQWQRKSTNRCRLIGESGNLKPLKCWFDHHFVEDLTNIECAA